jgi:N-acetylneuraminate synthase
LWRVGEEQVSEIFVIAEAGINHNGELDLAMKLIDTAHRAGCNAVKFQKRNPDICVPEAMKGKMRETPWGVMTYLDYKKKIEFGEREYDQIDIYCKELGILWSASAWDIDSLNFLNKYNLPFNKIASAMSTNLEFVSAVASQGKLAYASVGMCSWEDIDQLVKIFKDSNSELILMHTVSNYPAKNQDLNLKMIETLSKRYGVPVGYSGHEASISPSIVAAALGAVAIERHITINRSMWGTDHSASLEYAGINQLVGAIRKVPVVLGDGVKAVIPGEAEIAEKMRYWVD